MQEIVNIIQTYGSVFFVFLLILCGCIFLIKKIVSLTIEKMFSDSSSKKMQAHINILNRRTMAYEILVKKELEYYENINDFISEIVVLIQDVYWNYSQVDKTSDSTEKEKYKQGTVDNFTNLLKLIPKTKKDLLVFKNYSVVDVTNAHTNIVCYVQENSEKIAKIIKEKHTKNNDEVLKNITNELLQLSALLSAVIQVRQKELSE